MLEALKYLLITPFKPTASFRSFKEERHIFTTSQWMILGIVLVFAIDMGAHYDPKFHMTTGDWVAFYAGRLVGLVLTFLLPTYIVAVVLKRNGFEEVTFKKAFPYMLMIGLPIYASTWDVNWYFRPDGYVGYIKWGAKFWAWLLLTKVIRHLAPVSESKSWAIAFGVIVIEFLWHSGFWGISL
ncbi:hypothetical protein KFE98_16155 [bacterium SCSIO 12741]|nr:hypothetical protein KFE98_16155 [bacterium SCSIO 12741]